MNWYISVLKKYAVFSGRARRVEYWTFYLVNCLMGVAVGIVENMTGSGYRSGLTILYCLFILIPSLAVAVRRLHDTGRSGWWLFIAWVPFVGVIVLIVMLLQDSQPGENRYGPNPKALPVGA
jgi:uncharacterized membrane protein YhaH (DUF805 family)